MIRYKRIYPLRNHSRLAAIVTVLGNDTSWEISCKFKAPTELEDLVIIFFNPKTYGYEMHPLRQRMVIPKVSTAFTGCVIACRRGMFLDFLMEGALGKTRISTPKLKSAIAMDIYTGNGEQLDCPSAEPTPDADEQQAHQNLVDYLNSLEHRTDTVQEDKEPCPEPKEHISQPQAVPLVKSSTNGTCTIDGVSLSQELSDAKLQYCEFINPFKDRWNGVWWKVQYPDKNWHYIVGRVLVDGHNVSVLGIPGDRHNKPVCLESCDMFAIDDSGAGYWLMFQS